jgi:hypothetical protein
MKGLIGTKRSKARRESAHQESRSQDLAASKHQGVEESRNRSAAEACVCDTRLQHRPESAHAKPNARLTCAAGSTESLPA